MQQASNYDKGMRFVRCLILWTNIPFSFIPLQARTYMKNKKSGLTRARNVQRSLEVIGKKRNVSFKTQIHACNVALDLARPQFAARKGKSESKHLHRHG